MKTLFEKRVVACFALACMICAPSPAQEKATSNPLKALLIAGGCCHDYRGQTKALSEGIQSMANVQVDVFWVSDASVNPPLPLYEKKTWADGYDVIIHDECAAGNKDLAVMNRILEVHKTIPAVHLHCAMHSFRNGTDAWAKHLGLLSTSHGPQVPIEIKFTDTDHPITKTLSDWTTIKEELYNNAKMHTAHPLATGTQHIKRGEKSSTVGAVVAWTNEASGARSFSTSLGHNTATVQDKRYLELVTRGLLWTCDKLNDDYLKAFQGKNSVRLDEGVEIYHAKQAAKKAAAMASKMPKNATLVKVTASGVQPSNELIHCVDGDDSTRWCASNGSYPQWLQLEFDQPKSISGIRINWEFDKVYHYKVSGSLDGKTWTVLSDQSKNERANPFDEPFASTTKAKFLKIDGLGSRGGWCSIREVAVRGEGIESLWPAMAGNEFKPAATLGDPFKKAGNILPEIVPPTDTEASLLKSVRVPDGFEATIFAAPPAVNYPVFVAAAPDGTLYVSSDGNGSLGRDPGRGRVIRLRDLDGDGRADETKVFCEIDSPRGLVWDNDRLYLMHPPHLSVFIDRDRDGVSDEQNILVKNLAFGYDKRPADHTTNGLSLGVDGYLYVAGGDFGFIDAEGTDGTKLTHRGGGVIRVRHDGSGLELYSTGTRNILEVAISPQMDLFARDNTNDGGGWDVRFHHFMGGEDHGYPRLYKNFNDECIQPLADYGGGSGCGAVYVDEPGFGKWNGPLTADWGKGRIFHHQVEPDGATFRETRPPVEFARVDRATDADVDAMGRVYAASWRGASFSWAGPNVGYIVCIKPAGFQPKPLPEFNRLSDQQLIDLFASPSYRRRVAAQRELMRRGNSAASLLLEKAVATRTPERNSVDRLIHDASNSEVAEALSSSDPVVVHVAIRALAARSASAEAFELVDKAASGSAAALRSLAMMHQRDVVSGLMDRCEKLSDDGIHRGILAALCRLHFIEGDWKGNSWGTRPDTRGPYYQPEPWSETDRIADFLKSKLANAASDEAAFLVRELNRNRVHFNESTKRILELAAKDSKLIPDAVRLVAATNDTSAEAFPMLVNAANSKSSDAATLASAIMALSRYDREDGLQPILAAISRLETISGAGKEQQSGKNAFFNSRLAQNQIHRLVQIAKTNTEQSFWANATIMQVAAKKNASPEALQTSQKHIDETWATPDGRLHLIRVVEKTRSHHIDGQILTALEDPNPEIAKAAADAAKRLRLSTQPNPDSPLIKSLNVQSAVAQVIKTKGDRGRGESLFTKANCVACHTISKDVPQKGPYLGNIAQTYKRPDLAAAILQPSKTIAQGFATTSILTDEGRLVVGFVTKESADEVKVRDANAKEFTISKDEIEIRKTLKTSVMPEGLMNEYTVHDVASILDYLQALAK